MITIAAFEQLKLDETDCLFFNQDSSFFLFEWEVKSLRKVLP